MNMKYNCRLLFPLFFFLIIMLPAGVSGAAQDAIAVLKKADKAYKSNEYDKAAQLYKEVLKSKPEDAKANFRLGYIYLERQQPDLAVQHLKKAHAVSPGIDKELPQYLAEAYHQNHNFEEAQQMYFSLLQKTNPKKKYQYQLLEKRIQECASGTELLESPVRFEIENLGQSFNSKSADHVPVPTSDGKELYFTSRRVRKIAAAAKDIYDAAEADEDIFLVSMDAKESAPVRLSSSLNTLNHDAVVAISADDQTLFLYNENNGGDIYFVTKTKTGKWGEAKPLPAPINSKYFEPSVCFSKDGNFAFFSSDRPGGFGGLDLYISMKQPDGTWSEAMNLGHTINSAFDEDAPHLGPMEETLYFSSRGHNSMGGYDVFKSTLNGAMWTKARNLGYPVNSAADDIYYTLVPGKQEAYLSSDRAGGFGEKDLYLVKPIPVPAEPMLVSAEPEPTPAVPVPEPAPLAVKPAVKEPAAPAAAAPARLVLSGNVLDLTTRKPLKNARIVVTDNKLQKILYTVASDSVTGAYALELHQGKNYGLAIEKDGYLFFSENLELGTSSIAWNLEKDFELEKIEAGAKIVLKNIFFESGKASLNKTSASELERLIGLMAENPTLKVEISGHTDNTGSAALNQTLSVKRANAVVAHLVAKGVAKERLQAKGYGFTKPVATNETAEGRSLNRRTEFAILAK